MKLRAMPVVLLALVVLLPLSHLEFERVDDSWLLRVDGRPVDMAGALAQAYTRWQRDCGPVQAVAASEALHAEVLSALRQHSPPDSNNAELTRLTRLGPWLLAQVRFGVLQDALVLLEHSEAGVHVAEGGVWSGTTHPHRPEPLIRRYLQSRVPAAPAQLLACWDAPD
mgnify:CR=1 FL=1